MEKINWKAIDENEEFKKLVPGGYICEITSVVDFPDKQYLKLEYDIADGEFKNFYRELDGKLHFWGGNFIRSYKEKARPFFKGFLTAIEKSNQGFIADDFNGDENLLKRKFIGLVLGEEEYITNDREIKTRLYVDSVRSIQSIKSGDFKVPPFKKLESKKANYPTSPTAYQLPLTDDDLPF